MLPGSSLLLGMVCIYLSSSHVQTHTYVCMRERSYICVHTHYVHTYVFHPLHGCCCSVAQWGLILCNPMGCSTPGFPILYHLPEFAQTHVHWVSDAIQPSHSLLSSSPAFNLSQHQDFFPVSWLFASGGQSIGASASASVLPMNIQGWFPLVLTGLISLESNVL